MHRFLLAAAFVFVSALCSSATASERPNVLFLLTDDQRPDTIAALGNEHIETPHLDRLVREGTAFRRAVCANPICTPSRAEIITGCSGFTNGVLDFGRKIDPELATWAGTMAAAGYRTGYVGKWHNNGRPSTHGFQEAVGLFSGGGGQWWKGGKDWKGMEITGYRGWVFQSMDGKTKYPEKGVGLTPDISETFADAAISFLNSDDERPFFLQVNFTAPHDPLFFPTGYESMYDADKLPLPPNFLPRHPFDHGNFDGRDEKLLPWPRTPEMVRKNLAVYYAVISHLDAQVGRILKSLDETGLAENTLVIFSSDHGLAVGSHGLRGKQSMYEHTINVPLVFRGPGVPKGELRSAQCYLRDLFPTACEFAGIAIPKSVEGESLKDVIQRKDKSVYSHVFCYFRDKQRMVRDDRWKLIYYPHLERYQLFDLKNDPFEKTDLVGEARYSDALERMKAVLESEIGSRTSG